MEEGSRREWYPLCSGNDVLMPVFWLAAEAYPGYRAALPMLIGQLAIAPILGTIGERWP